MTQRIHLGISTCPNDTFAFAGLLTGAIKSRRLDLRIELMDVEQLNQRLFRGDFDAAKASFHTALLLADQVGVLGAGSALGFGVGPVLLSHHADKTPEQLPGARVLCPGEHTTAALLYRIFHPTAARPEHVVFSEIMPALETRAADFGVCIHEGRFTYQSRGLHCVEDLGATWEQATGGPLPLGGIVARHRLGESRLRTLADLIGQSIDWAHAHRDAALDVMRQYAQEQSDEVIWAHVDLYVNQWTRDLGAEGAAALKQLHDKAVESKIIQPGCSLLRIVGR